MADLNDLYQEVILDHNKRPRNFRTIEGASHHADGYNPLCGDKLRLTLRMAADRITDVKFDGSGCAISKASASMMTTELKGKSEAEAEKVFNSVHKMLTGEMDVEEDNLERLGKLKILSGVCKFPARVKCASLAWHTVNAALKGTDEVASTE